MNKIPVFFINGILEAGKTTFILDTIRSDGFPGKTLLISCEQGEIEYDEDELSDYKTTLVYFSDVKEFNESNLNRLVRETEADRIVIEFNGMWDLKQIQFPYYLELVQVIAFIDTSTFKIYFNNMRQKFNDMISQSEAVLFTKYTNPKEEIEPYKATLKMMNSRCEFYIMDETNRAYPAFEEPLPYDINAPIIKIADEDYAIFYMDTFENKNNYEGKIVEYDIQVFLSKKLPKNTFIAGRMIMSCCADDMQLYGFLVNSTMNKKLKDRSWIHLKAEMHIEYSEIYKEEEIVLTPISIEEIESKKEILDLVNG